MTAGKTCPTVLSVVVVKVVELKTSEVVTGVRGTLMLRVRAVALLENRRKAVSVETACCAVKLNSGLKLVKLTGVGVGVGAVVGVGTGVALGSVVGVGVGTGVITVGEEGEPPKKPPFGLLLEEPPPHPPASKKPMGITRTVD